MILYVIRHGHPDYALDSLLPDGREQAEKVALRMQECGVDAIYSSPMGRSLETAQPTAAYFGLPVTILPWARELDEENHSNYPDGKKKLLSRVDGTYWMKPEHRTLSLEESFAIPGMNDYGFSTRYQEISSGLDQLIAHHGYQRTEEGFYQPLQPNEAHVALFCHAAMGRVVFSHLMNIPPQFAASSLMPFYTGMMIFSFSKDAHKPVVPMLHAYGDIGHLYTPGNGPVYEERAEQLL